VSADELKTALSIAGMVFGGAWALIRIFFSQREKIENLEKQSVITLIDKTQTQIEELVKMVKEVSEKFSEEIDGLKKETAELRVMQASHLAEMKLFGKTMLEVHRHFAGEREEFPQSEKQQIGKDAWIIRDKKRTKGEGE
jgi:hypothetical protein